MSAVKTDDEKVKTDFLLGKRKADVELDRLLLLLLASRGRAQRPPHSSLLLE
jgi:hypothetical protein